MDPARAPSTHVIMPQDCTRNDTSESYLEITPTRPKHNTFAVQLTKQEATFQVHFWTFSEHFGTRIASASAISTGRRSVRAGGPGTGREGSSSSSLVVGVGFTTKGGRREPRVLETGYESPVW
eukprot:418649-Rhodomonas_salina.1